MSDDDSPTEDSPHSGHADQNLPVESAASSGFDHDLDTPDSAEPRKTRLHRLPPPPEDTGILAREFVFVEDRLNAKARYLLAFAFIIGVTIAGHYLETMAGYRAIGLMLLLAVVCLAPVVGRGPTILSAGLSALLWDYFFLPPRFSFVITRFEDLTLFVTYVVVVTVLGQLMARVSAQKAEQQRREMHSHVLYQLVTELASAQSLSAVAEIGIRRGQTLFGVPVAILTGDSNGKANLTPHPSSSFAVSLIESDIAAMALDLPDGVGATSSIQPEAEGYYVPMGIAGRAVGVLGIRLAGHRGLSLYHRQLLSAFAQHIGVALERRRLYEATEAAREIERAEKLTKSLLDSMAHEVRTPLAVIQTAVGALSDLGDSNRRETRSMLLSEIHEATDRLNRLIGKVLDVTKLETGHLRATIAPVGVRNLVDTVLQEARKELATHPVTVDVAENLTTIDTDFVLTKHALLNLVSNAAFHTPEETPIRISIRADAGEILCEVSDRGPGIPDDAVPRLFEKFYRLPGAKPGGTGLGLSIVKGFIEAQGGTISVSNQEGGGACFTIRLPAQKVTSAA